MNVRPRPDTAWRMKPHIYKDRGDWRVLWQGGSMSGFDSFRDLVGYMRRDLLSSPRKKRSRYA